jgi:hypothetical protein
MAILEAAGYQCTKSGASLGAWDVIGIGRTDFVLCQVKSNRNPGSIEMETLKMFPCPWNCRKLIHIWKDRARLPIVKDVDWRQADGLPPIYEDIS